MQKLLINLLVKFDTCCSPEPRPLLNVLPTPPSKRKGRALAAVLSNELKRDSGLLPFSFPTLSETELLDTTLLCEVGYPLLGRETTFTRKTVKDFNSHSKDYTKEEIIEIYHFIIT
jgi:hypothetical protein